MIHTFQIVAIFTFTLPPRLIYRIFYLAVNKVKCLPDICVFSASPASCSLQVNLSCLMAALTEFQINLLQHGNT